MLFHGGILTINVLFLYLDYDLLMRLTLQLTGDFSRWNGQSCFGSSSIPRAFCREEEQKQKRIYRA